MGDEGGPDVGWGGRGGDGGGRVGTVWRSGFCAGVAHTFGTSAASAKPTSNTTQEINRKFITASRNSTECCGHDPGTTETPLFQLQPTPVAAVLPTTHLLRASEPIL